MTAFLGFDMFRIIQKIPPKMRKAVGEYQNLALFGKAPIWASHCLSMLTRSRCGTLLQAFWNSEVFDFQTTARNQ